MSIPRLFIDTTLSVGQCITLPQDAGHYAIHVLRLRLDEILLLFNGLGGEYQAKLISITKKTVEVQIDKFNEIERESPLQLTLVQAISRPEHMDYTIQKATELGVYYIVPILTERSPPLDKNRFEKREQHWHKIIISACEQCGRNRLPTLFPIQSLTDWFTHFPKHDGIVLSPLATSKLQQTIKDVTNTLTILVGAEGGLTEYEIQQARLANYTEVQLGQRILRTETASTVILAVCQNLWGDI